MPKAQADNTDTPDAASEKKLATNDRPVTIVSTSGDYQGMINLNFASVPIHRVSDLFIKADIAFLPLYNATVKGNRGKEILINTKDIAVVLPHDSLPVSQPELRKDARLLVKLKYGLGHLAGKVNLWGETQPVDRVSDLLNIAGKKWLTVYDVNYKGKGLAAAVINLDFISTVEDSRP